MKAMKSLKRQWFNSYFWCENLNQWEIQIINRNLGTKIQITMKFWKWIKVQNTNLLLDRWESTDRRLDRSESLDLGLDRFDLTDLLDLSESLDLGLKLDLVDLRDFPESLDLGLKLDLTIRDFAESLPLSPNPQPLPNLGVSVLVNSSLSGLVRRRDFWLSELLPRFCDLIDREDFIGLRPVKLQKSYFIEWSVRRTIKKATLKPLKSFKID